MKRLVTLLAVAALVLVGCGDGEEASDEDIGTGAGGATSQQGGTDHAGHATSSCSPSGTTLTITVNGVKFDKDCLAAPADQAFTLNYENKDTVGHNIAILESHSSSSVFFRADIFTGPKTQTFNIPALKPGTYAFHCEVHPGQMSGTFIVK